MTEPDKEIEETYSYDRGQLVAFLERFTNDIRAGTIQIGSEHVQIPSRGMDVEYDFKIEKGQSEIEIEVKWTG
ncbi:MAG: amphi-Trp domain-containing protein [Candidatus Thermoplasmatota archaeon]|nr:amphi-Trp domain-containing protein [Candidatus Thermoplasmatota archaeon]